MTETSQNARPRHRTASLIMLILAVLGLLVLLFTTTVVVPKFGKIFTDLLEGKTLPGLTQLVLSIPTAVYLVACAGAIAALIHKEVRIGNRAMTLTINAAALAVVMVLLLVLTVALFLPLTGIIIGLQPSSPDSR